jgi:hypothetical protein
VRFKDFLLEGPQFDVNKFMKDCAPFLNEITGINRGDLPKHGTKRAPDDWAIIQHEQRLGSRDSDPRLHQAVNDLFGKRFGWLAREEAIFVTGDFNIAHSYGPTTILIPIGPYKYLWSPSIRDLWGTYDDIRSDLSRELRRVKSAHSLSWEDVKNQAIDKTVEVVHDAEWLFSEGLKDALSTGNEIMLRPDSDKFYQIRFMPDPSKPNVYDQVIEALTEHGIIT